jgi:hypothetical protein
MSQLSPALSHVRVADDPDRNLLFIAEELPELAQERNQGTLTKGVRHRSMERDGRALLRQLTDPPLGDPGRDKVDLVENVNEVLWGATSEARAASEASRGRGWCVIGVR